MLAIIYVPFLDPIFNTAFLGWREWSLMLPLLFVPAVAAEITKVFLRMPRLQGWFHPSAAPTMLEAEYANPGSEEVITTLE